MDDVWGGGFEKSELVILAEQLHKLKSKRSDIELELSELRFRYKYVPQRMELAGSQLSNLLLLAIPLSVLLAIVIGACAVMVLNENYADFLHGLGGLLLLAGGIFIVVGGYADIVLIKHIIPLMRLLSKKKNPNFSKYDTIQSDVIKTKEKISSLESELFLIQNEINEKEEWQKKLLDEKERAEAILRDKGILYDENPNLIKNKGISLKESSYVNTNEAAELFEYLGKEETYIQAYIIQLEGRLSRINKSISDIDDAFDGVKKRIIFSFIVFVFVVIMQSQFTGLLQSITSIICLFASIAYIFYLDKVCKRPVLDYLIEHDSIFTKEYAFCSNAVPMYEKRKEVINQIEKSQMELLEIKKQKEMIEF